MLPLGNRERRTERTVTFCADSILVTIVTGLTMITHNECNIWVVVSEAFLLICFCRQGMWDMGKKGLILARADGQLGIGLLREILLTLPLPSLSLKFNTPFCFLFQGVWNQFCFDSQRGRAVKQVMQYFRNCIWEMLRGRQCLPKPCYTPAGVPYCGAQCKTSTRAEITKGCTSFSSKRTQWKIDDKKVNQWLF